MVINAFLFFLYLAILISPCFFLGCIWKDEIYISGGFAGGGGEDDYNYEDRVYRYAPCEDKWQDRAAMLHKRSYHVMCCIGDKMYVAGGTVYPGYDPFIDVNVSISQWGCWVVIHSLTITK